MRVNWLHIYDLGLLCTYTQQYLLTPIMYVLGIEITPPPQRTRFLELRVPNTALEEAFRGGPWEDMVEGFYNTAKERHI